MLIKVTERNSRNGGLWLKIRIKVKIKFLIVVFLIVIWKIKLKIRYMILYSSVFKPFKPYCFKINLKYYRLSEIWKEIISCDFLLTCDRNLPWSGFFVYIVDESKCSMPLVIYLVSRQLSKISGGYKKGATKTNISYISYLLL